MKTTPIRMLKLINIEFFSPKAFSQEITQQLIQAAEQCPVIHSLHPEVQKIITYHWGM